LAIAACCLALRPRARGATEVASWARDIAWAVAATVLILVLALVVPWLTQGLDRVRDMVVYGVPAVVCCTLLDRPRRLALALAGVLAAGLWIQARWAGTFHAERNFFGVTRVARSGGGEFHQLVHGNTIHGRQYRDPARQGEPLTYYHRQGPLGSLFGEFQRRQPGGRVGVIGLGIGSMAAYARPSESWDFFEIDPAVIRVARDPAWFSFLSACQAGSWRVVEGDARLRLGEMPDAGYDLLVLDAFSSDAIPVHLLTREALAVYRAKLKPDGWLAVHLSNRYLELEPVVAALADDAGWVSRSQDDTAEGDFPGKEASHWMVLAADEAALGRLPRRSAWVPPSNDAGLEPWTDRRAPVWEVFSWR
ncbi:MAG: fused MFS/spermidine synthase, partial [Gammaproteobacteria bacterium]|nr:fused MFS/spermidine synthase [Gammaproteobacteria bacterium]